MGNSEGLDPLQTNVFVRKSYAGEFICLNKYLVEDLIKLNLWNPKLKNRLVAENGSI